ncbi:uncharacterized protein LOC141855470 isoform X1 [Brevipalpus obovatus]|uniref:uncharacterized protein LOC141855470 isoform X1 n=1 Tax=Brevipalpus obovatus TaxID=246614 RepID=UPI003D9F76A8
MNHYFSCQYFLTLIVLVIILCASTIFADQRRFFEPVNGCETRPCGEPTLNECSASGRAWAAFQLDGATACICCDSESDAQQAAGGLSSPGIGFFYGNRHRVCETVRADEGLCFSRQSRDCNYLAAFRNKEFIGCFYCRPRCDHDQDCQDLGRTCGIHKADQPVRSCTGMGSGLIPGRDDPRDYEAAIRKNYLIVVKVSGQVTTPTVHQRKVISSLPPPPPPTPMTPRPPIVGGLGELIQSTTTSIPNDGFIVVKNNHKGFDRTPPKDDAWPTR